MMNRLLRSDLAHRLSQESRRGKLERFCRIVGDTARARIIDVGAGSEWEGAENTLERWYPRPDRIIAVCLEDEIHRLKAKYPPVNWVKADGLRLPFGDKVFDVAFSNAVIEHIIGDAARHQLST